MLLRASYAVCGALLFAVASSAAKRLNHTIVPRARGCRVVALGALVTLLVFWLAAGHTSDITPVGVDSRGRLCTLVLLSCLAVASANDLETQSVPDSVWAAGAVGRLVLGLAYGRPDADLGDLAAFLVTCLAIVYLPRPPQVGGADVAAFITIALFIGPGRALFCIWTSCIVAALSAIGSGARQVPFLPYLLCGACLACRGSP